MRSTFFQRTPAAFIFLWFAAGIVMFQYANYNYAYISLIVIGILCLLFYKYYKNNIIYGIGIAIILAGTGALSTNIFNSNHNFGFINKKGIFQLEITDYPKEKQNSYQLEVKALKYSKDSIHFISATGKAIVYIAKTNKAKDLKVGNHILIAGTFKKPKNRGNPEEFNYAEYLKQKGINATCYADSNHWIKDNSINTEFSLKRLASKLRDRLLEIYKTNGIKGENLAVLGALTLGYTDNLNNDIRNEYSDAGAMHVLAVSGLHVGIIYIITRSAFVK